MDLDTAGQQGGNMGLDTPLLGRVFFQIHIQLCKHLSKSIQDMGGVVVSSNQVVQYNPQEHMHAYELCTVGNVFVSETPLVSVSLYTSFNVGSPHPPAMTQCWSMQDLRILRFTGEYFPIQNYCSPVPILLQ